jgi:PAS domain S-box-containing protein
LLEEIALLKQRIHELEVSEKELKRTEEVLRESEEKYRSLLETSTQGILIYDQNGILQLVNPAMVNLLGAKSYEELVGRPYFDFIHPDDRAESRTRIEKMFSVCEKNEELNEGQVSVKAREHRMIKVNGEVVSVESAGVAFQHQGIIYLQGIFRDITKRKQAEEEREKLILELKDALSKIKILSGLLPICASCKKIRNDEGYWEQIEGYIKERSDAEFSHGICPECMKKLYPDFYERHFKNKDD